jgi:hypothetical protein
VFQISAFPYSQKSEFPWRQPSSRSSTRKADACKTTTAINLAAALTETGARVLVIDDPESHSASDWRLQGGITAIGRSIRRALADDYKLPQLRAEIPDRTVLMIG